MEAAQLAGIPLFAGLTPDQRASVARVCEEMEVEDGSTLVREGDFGYSMFAILSGTAEIVKGGVLVGTLADGDVFGEIAVLSGGRRAATIVATSPMTVATLMNRDLWRLEREIPDVGSALRAKIESHVGAGAGAEPA